MENLKSYSVLVALTVVGETEDDAMDYVFSAIDNSDLLAQDGIIGAEVMEDDVEEIITDTLFNDEEE
jgi:hypothetical protein